MNRSAKKLVMNRKPRWGIRSQQIRPSLQVETKLSNMIAALRITASLNSRRPSLDLLPDSNSFLATFVRERGRFSVGQVPGAANMGEIFR